MNDLRIHRPGDPNTFFDSFRRDLCDAKAVYIADYYLVCHFCNYDAPITSQVSINIVNY